jgi:hypothetical protein
MALRLKLSGMTLAACMMSTVGYADRLDDYVAEAAAKGRHSAVAQALKTAHTWSSWNAASPAEAQTRALSGCATLVSTGCQIIAVDGKLNGRQQRTISTPATIVVFDHVSGAKQNLSGVLRRTNSYQEVSEFQLVTSAGKVLCSGNLSFSRIFGIGTFSGAGQCFGQTATRSAGGDQKRFRMDYGGSYMEVSLNY